ncbi:sigma-70 family RNA polymerase sigma factor [Parasulfuritortus cantonensis]|uniref:RNA polymerase sigma factor n=1 Tax=Parasulfuritortus cantonensis TaxID=2528202 RepID=A0A4R1B7H0_9PROT|nr:sigma-70 family RNA polymerase sigma factor [Parasulfuritortus cantonensis]TCJ12967.1 sigma-70 family RNA polymerase sigma factor [Parasulfuritortus cantonensis]
MICVQRAWHVHEGELRAWLRGHLHDRDEAEDVLQDVLLKAIRQGKRFCAIGNPRAWLFEVTRHTLIDRLRLRKALLPLPEDLAGETEDPEPVASLAGCLPRVLAELTPEDREVLTLCDLENMTQADYAALKGLSLAGAKSRVQRARKRLRAHLTRVCQVRFDANGKVCCFVPRHG